jgi:hypothetical protein
MLYLVGAGALGSNIAPDLSKRSLATKVAMDLKVIDFDTVEERNIVAQNFEPDHIGKKKAQVISDICGKYSTVNSSYSLEKLDENTVKKLKFDSDLDMIIDCVDNIETRHLLWMTGILNSIPVCHVGMTTTGQGVVQWSYFIDGMKIVDNFSLSPDNLCGKKIAVEDRKLAPCELSGFRSLILNTAQAAMNAICIFRGNDPSDFLEEGQKSSGGIMAVFQTTEKSISELKALRVDPNK